MKEMSLTETERETARRIQFSERVLELVKQATGTEALDALSRDDEVEDASAPDGARRLGTVTYALIAATPRATSEDVLLGLRSDLLPLGYLPFLLDRTLEFQERPDTLAVLKTTDPLAPLRFAETADPNGDKSPFDIQRVFEGWRARFEFDILGAESDSAYLRLHTLPTDMKSFAAEVYDFCPDILDQGFGIVVEEGWDYLPAEQRAEIEQLFAADSGDEEGKPQRVALHLLARAITETRRLYLWWD